MSGSWLSVTWLDSGSLRVAAGLLRLRPRRYLRGRSCCANISNSACLHRDRIIAVTVAQRVEAPLPGCFVVGGVGLVAGPARGIRPAQCDASNDQSLPDRCGTQPRFPAPAVSGVIVERHASRRGRRCAVASDCFTWFWPVESSGIESFPEFSAYVREHYHPGPVSSLSTSQACCRSGYSCGQTSRPRAPVPDSF